MADFPVEDGGAAATAGVVSATTTGTLLTASSTAHVKGAYAEFVASTPFDADEVWVSVMDNSGPFTRLLDIAVGAAGSESVIIPNILGSYPRANEAGYYHKFACHVPAGSRLAGRIQSSVASSTLRVFLHLVSRGLSPSTPLQRIIAYGALTASSRGTAVDPGATAHTKGAWVQLGQLFFGEIRRLALALATNANTAMASARWLLDIGAGAVGSEVVLIPDLPVITSTTADNIVPRAFDDLPVQIKAGERITARMQCSITDATDRVLEVVAYGMD